MFTLTMRSIRSRFFSGYDIVNLSIILRTIIVISTSKRELIERIVSVLHRNADIAWLIDM